MNIEELSIVKAHKRKRAKILFLLWSVPFIVVAAASIFVAKTTLFINIASIAKLLSALFISTSFFIWLYVRSSKKQYKCYSYKEEPSRCSSDELITLYQRLEKRKPEIITVTPTHVFILSSLSLQAIPVNKIVWINHFQTYQRFEGVKSHIHIVTRDKRVITLLHQSTSIELDKLIKLLRVYRPHLLFSSSDQIFHFPFSIMSIKNENESIEYLKLFNSDFERMVQLSDGD